MKEMKRAEEEGSKHATILYTRPFVILILLLFQDFVSLTLFIPTEEAQVQKRSQFINFYNKLIAISYTGLSLILIVFNCDRNITTRLCSRYEIRG